MIILISPFSPQTHDPSKVFIPIQYHISPSLVTRASFIFLLFITYSISFSSSLAIKDQTQHRNQDRNQNQEIMKVHPLPKKRNNVTIQYYINNGDNRRNSSSGASHKKLRRLPHIFSRVLELPFRSDAEVSVEENPDCFRFVAVTDIIGEVRAHMIEIHPGVTKIVIRPDGHLEVSSLDDLELDMWRFRLPESTRPELASAVFTDGELIVTVPKGDEVDEDRNGNTVEFRGGMGNNNNDNNARLVLVQ